MATIAVASLGLLSLIQVPTLGDPFQAPRALTASVAVLIILTVARSRTEPSLSGRHARVAAVALVVLCVTAALAAFANSPSSSIWGVHGRLQGLMSLALLVVAALGGFISRGHGVRRLSSVIGCVLAGQSLILLWQAVAGAVPTGTFGNSAIAAAWLCVAFAVTVADALVSRGRRIYLMFSASALGLVALGATGTRGAWIGALAGAISVLAALTLRSPASHRATRRGPVVAIGVAAVLLVGAMVGGPDSTVAKLSPSDLRVGSSASRIEIWRSSLTMIAEKPLLGVGPGRFIYAFPAYQTVQQARIEGADVRPDQAHNLILHTAVESGIIAALALAIVIGCALIASWRAAARGSGVGLLGVAALSAWSAQAAFGVPALETDVLAWFLGGACVAASLVGETTLGSQSTKGWRVLLARPALVVGSCTLVVAFATYVTANVVYSGAIAAFAQGRFDQAQMLASRASLIDPWTDVYRVAMTDAALYRGGSALEDAKRFVSTGLSLEPDSYDLLIARARILAASSAPVEEIAFAYSAALHAFPFGATVLDEATEAYGAAGWPPPKPTDAQRDRSDITLAPSHAIPLRP